MNISAVIMAAGLSKRMNQNKLQMKINNKFIFEYIFNTIKNCEVYFKEIIVVTNDDTIIRKAKELGYIIVKNEESYLGQSSSIKLGLKNASNSDGFMFFVSDQPFITKCTIRKLIEAFEKNQDSIIMACYNEINGNPVIFPKNYKEQLLKLEGDTGGKAIIKNNLEKLKKININTDDEFIDIDTMEDYNKVLKRRCMIEG